MAPIQTDKGCIFQNEEGLCSLHDKGLKPLEGRLAHHDLADFGLRPWIVKKWINPKGLAVLKLFTNDPMDLFFIRSRMKDSETYITSE